MAKELSKAQQKAIQEKLAKMSPEELQDLIKQQCIFCKIAKGEIESNIVYEDSNVMAALDVQPANPGHVIVFPKEHYSIIQQMPDADVARLFALVKYVSSAVFEATGAQGTNVMLASGALAGQKSPHVLVHVIPRFEKDGMPSEFWKPKQLKEEQMAEIAKRVKGALANVKTSSVSPKEKKEIKKGAAKLTKVKPRAP
tara:strand:+ start:1014 stop:1607 length:594 start_codon:yes stop_codon:yes gene_type:complete